MPSINRITTKNTIIDSCEFRAKIRLYRRETGKLSSDSLRYASRLVKIADCYAVYDSAGSSVPYFDRVNNLNSGITDYFYIRKSSLNVDKRCVVDCDGKRYNVSGITDLGKYYRLNCSVTGDADKTGSIV